MGRYIAGGSEWDYTPAILHCDIGPPHTLYDPDDWNADFLDLALQAYHLEPRAALMPRIRISALLNLVWWTLWVKDKGVTICFNTGFRL